MDQLVETFECLTVFGAAYAAGFKCLGRSTSRGARWYPLRSDIRALRNRPPREACSADRAAPRRAVRELGDAPLRGGAVGVRHELCAARPRFLTTFKFWGGSNRAWENPPPMFACLKPCGTTVSPKNFRNVGRISNTHFTPPPHVCCPFTPSL